MKAQFACSLVLISILAVSGCAVFTADQYVGNGVWMRGDGSTYEAPAPLHVADARIIGQRLQSNSRTERTESTDEEGKKVIREREFVEIDTGLDIEIELEDGSLYTVFLHAAGRLNEQSNAQGSFVGPNGYPYNVTGRIYQSLDRPRVFLEVKSRGPVHYQNTLVAP